MSRLNSDDLQKLSDALAVLYAPASLEEFHARVFASFGYLFPSIHMSFNVIDAKTGVAFVEFNRPLPISAEESDERWKHTFTDHPGVRYFREGGGKRTVFRLRGSLSGREYHETGLYRDYFRLVDTEDQLISILPIPDQIIGTAINRDRVFTEEEFRLMELMQPHFVQAYQNARLLASIQSGAEAIDFKPWRAHGFTRRECEVLQWLMEGKRNAEIAVILGISPFTVKTHVERILARLGVENRAAAAVSARGILIGDARSFARKSAKP